MMTPKQQLQARADFKAIASMLNSPMLEQCCDCAMLTLVNNLPSGVDAQAAMAYHHKLDGAKLFLSTLRGLSNLAPERKPDMAGQLRHDV